MNDRKFRPELRVLAALAVAVVVAFWLTRPGSSAAPPAGTGPGLRVDFGTVSRVLDPAAIGVTGAGAAGGAGTAGGVLLRKLRLGYSGTSVSGVGPDAGSRVAAARAAGEVPVVAIPDSLTASEAAGVVKHAGTGAPGKPAPVRYWEITASSGESAASFSERFNTLYDAMKAVRPGIAIGESTGEYDGSFLARFLAGSGSRADFVGFSFYGENAVAPKTNGQLLAALAALSGDITGARKVIQAAVPARAAGIAIHIDGWDIADGAAPIQFTGFAATWDADLLGRILAGGAASLASRAGAGLVYDGQGIVPRAYQPGSPTPLYAAIGMFTGEGLFPRFGGGLASATSALPGVDVFASASPDEVVVVNTTSSAVDTVLRVSTSAQADGTPLRAGQWRLGQANGAVTAPASVGTATSRNGSFSMSLPSGSVTTVAVTAAGTGSATVAAVNASTGQCLVAAASGDVYTASCQADAALQVWRLSGTAVVSQRTGRCLTSDASGHVSAAPCDGSDAQDWYSLGSRLVSARTGRCLNGNGTGEVYTLACDGASQQNWTLRG
jgi:hypothetical protein